MEPPGQLSAEINNTASLRLAAFYQNLAKGDNFNEGTGKYFPVDRNYAGRATLRLTPAAGLEVLLKGEYDHLRDYGNTGEPIAQPTSGSLQFTEVNFNGVVDSNNNVAPFFQSNFVSVDNQTYQADVSYSALNGVFTSTSAYRKLTVGLSEGGAEPVPLFNGYIGYTYKQLSQELRYNGKVGNFDITGGFFYQNEDKDTVEVADFNFGAVGIPLPLLASNLIEAENTNSYSGYGDLTYHFTPKISLELGARYSDITRIANQANLPGDIVTAKGFDQGLGVTALNPALNPLATAIFGVPPHQFYGLHLHEDHLQPQVVGQYKITDKDQIYAKYVHSAQAGGFDIAYQGVPGDVSPPGAHFAPETASSVEVGLKGLAFDNKVDFAFDAFRTDFTNLQTSAYVGAATVAVVTNVGSARTQGFEGEVRYAPTNHLRFAATGTFLDAAYLDFPGGQCNRAQAAAQPVGCVQNLSDTPTPFASKWAGTFSADYDHPVAEYIVRGGVLVTARSRYNVSFNNEPLEEQGSYAQLDAHLDLRPQNGFWELSIFGPNLNDFRYNAYGSVAPGTTGGLIGFLSRGRELGVRVSFHE